MPVDLEAGKLKSFFSLVKWSSIVIFIPIDVVFNNAQRACIWFVAWLSY